MSDTGDTRSSTALLSTALQELGAVLLSTESFLELTQRIATLATRTIPPAITCGITVATNGRIVTAAAADTLGSLLDEQQYQLDEGPCLEALNTGLIVDAPDLSREERWAGYPVRAMAHGVSAVYSTPLRLRGESIGVLNLYAAAPHAFDGHELRGTIAQLSDLAVVAITGSLRNYGDATLTEQLQNALNTRAVIDQAIGIVMATRHCTPEEAFAILRTISQTRNVRLAVIAGDLVARTATTPVVER